jgi:hypothetical protein
MSTVFLSYDPRHGDGRGVNGLVRNNNRTVTLWNWQNYLTYNRTFNDAHNINAVAGMEYQQQVSKTSPPAARTFLTGFSFRKTFSRDLWAPRTLLAVRLRPDSTPTSPRELCLQRQVPVERYLAE